MAGWRYDAKSRRTGDGECGFVDAPSIDVAVERAREKVSDGFEVYIIARINDPGV